MWTCPNPECPPTEDPPKVEKPDEARRERSPLSTSQLAEWLKVPVVTIYAWRRMGYGPPGYRIGKRISYRPSDVQRWMVEQGWSRLFAEVSAAVRTGVGSSRRSRANRSFWPDEDQQP
jgi:hypothetical protein